MNVPVILRRRRLQYGGGVVPFSPLSLFASGEEGAWYEPSTTTAFLSTTNLTPCGYGDGCGLLLDKSQGAGYSGGSFTGLGSELVTNGTFDTDVSGWTADGAATSVSGGEVTINLSGTPSGGFANIYQAVTTEVGKSYLISGTLVSKTSSASNGYLIIGTGANVLGTEVLRVINDPASASTPVTNSVVYVATTTTTYIGAFAGNLGSEFATFDNISVRELPGNHATQATSSARPILARVPSGGRRNLLERTEEFDNAVWSKIAGSVSNDTSETADPLGGNTADKLTHASAINILQEINGSSGDVRTFSVYLKKSGTQSTCELYIYRAGVGFVVSFEFNFDTETYSLTQGTGSAALQSVGNGWYRCSVTGTLPASQAYTHGVYNATEVYAWGAQLEPGSSATAYQKVVDQYDITEAGVTSLDYLAFDGSDDGMATASIDFTGTDKMSVFAGVEKETASTFGRVLVELSASRSLNNGTFTAGKAGGSGSETSFFVASKGTIDAGVTDTNVAANVPKVITGLCDISGDSVTIRVDGTQTGETTTDQGTGNFGNYPLNIGARDAAGTASAFFDGKLFSLIVRGAASTAGEISDTESYVANLSGVSI